jgi:uncharacterized protein with FMN-binding domain
MRRAALAIVSTAIGLVLLLSFKTHPASSVASPPAAVSTPTPSGSSTTSGSASSSGSGPGTVTSSGSRTVTGNAVSTRYGPVQVQITLSGKRITSVNAVEYPTGTPRDQEINAYAIPALNQEAVSANSPNIDLISGATFTSEGYIQSLQSALDKP